MSTTQRSGPRTGQDARAGNVNRGTGRRGQSTARRPDRERFVPAHPWTVAEIETALATADAPALVRALDLHPAAPSAAATCPACGALRAVTALGRWHWSCEACGALGSWLALRQPVAMSVEACVRLAGIVHGIREVVA